MCTCVFVCALRKKNQVIVIMHVQRICTARKRKNRPCVPSDRMAIYTTHIRRRISYLVIVQRRVHSRRIYIIRSDTLTERLYGLGATCTERGPVVRKHNGQRNENSGHTCAQRRDDCKNFRRGRVRFFFKLISQLNGNYRLTDIKCLKYEREKI